MTFNLIILIAALAGIILGALVCALILRNKNSILKTNLENISRQLEETKRQASADAAAAENRLRERLAEVKADEQKHYRDALATQDKANDEAMQVLKEHYDKSIREQQERFDTMMSKMTEQSKVATEDLLKARQKEFAESSSTNIEEIVKPLKDTIATMEKTLKESSDSAISISSAMKENLDTMIQQSKETQKTTEELTNAFKHRTKVQGNWGETVLAELLASQGLTEGIQFHTQATLRDEKGQTIRNEEGSRMIPDVILHLDEKREVIIDSKVSLTAFFDYVNAEDETMRDQYLKAHISSVTNHVKELAKKDYSSYIQPPKVKMDYVIMFVPHIGALWTALNAQPDLWRKAMEQNVFIADEQTLFAVLKIINMTWTQIKQAQNHEEVYKLASQMVDRVGQFVKHYDEMGKALKNAQEAYDNGKGKLEEKGHSIIVSARHLIELGAKNGKNPLPPARHEEEE